MTHIFVTRHPGARAWAHTQGIAARQVTHLDPETVRGGDVVMGTLPVHIAAQVCARGARYLHLRLDLPPDLRGRDLSADDMTRAGARLEPYHLQASDTRHVTQDDRA